MTKTQQVPTDLSAKKPAPAPVSAPSGVGPGACAATDAAAGAGAYAQASPARKKPIDRWWRHIVTGCALVIVLTTLLLCAVLWGAQNELYRQVDQPDSATSAVAAASSTQDT